ncbi:MAG: LD-carboxypeptidase [Flavobacteriaceae bacterium]|nr:LD-carboxypeptidase [Flavobacteriaceae bacterium]
MIKRRHFLSGLLSISATTLLASTTKTTKITKKTLYPKRLEKGQTIGLIAPGFAVSQEKMTQMVFFLEQSGFKVFQTGRIGQEGYFSNTDEQRALDVMEMFSNPNVDAILCARGGYGCTRILDLLDYKIIENNPKILLGFSDVTALIQGIYSKTGLIGFHGPVGTTIENQYAQSCIQGLLMNLSEQTTIKPVNLEESQYKSISEYQRYTIYPGIAKGKLIGGSLTLITALIGTPYEIDFTDCIVCIEDVEEKPYRIDRMLTQLLGSKTFKAAAGIAFGVCAGCDTEKNQNNFTLREVIENRISPLKIPAAYGLSFGHVPDNCTLPIGAQSVFNTTLLEITVTEPVVI